MMGLILIFLGKFLIDTILMSREIDKKEKEMREEKEFLERLEQNCSSKVSKHFKNTE